jgi:hypothetical protein
MPIIIDKTRTDSYIGTFKLDDPQDKVELEKVRKFVSNMNKMLKEDGYKYRYRVLLHGRLGKDNPSAKRYREKPSRYRTIRLSDAHHVDAYILPRK